MVIKASPWPRPSNIKSCIPGPQRVRLKFRGPGDEVTPSFYEVEAVLLLVRFHLASSPGSFHSPTESRVTRPARFR